MGCSADPTEATTRKPAFSASGIRRSAESTSMTVFTSSSTPRSVSVNGCGPATMLEIL